MFNILSQITLKVKFLKNEEQHCLLPSLVDDFTCVHSKNALLTHILSTLFSSTSVLFSCTPFGTKSINYICIITNSIDSLYLHTAESQDDVGKVRHEEREKKKITKEKRKQIIYSSIIAK